MCTIKFISIIELSIIPLSKVPKCVVRDDADTGKREIGFSVTTTLTPSSDIQVFETLQVKYKLEQWVTDKYWLEVRSTDTSTDWTDTGWEVTAWERDQFGEDGDKGKWNSDRKETTFLDEPGFLGKGKRKSQTALTKTQRLGDYEIKFYWKVFDGSKCIKKTEEITLKAEPDDSGRIAYSTPISEVWTVNV